MNAKYLHLGGNENNVIFALYNQQFNATIRFHSLDLYNDFDQTPLSEFYKRGTLLESKYPSTQLSDALRLVYLYKVSFVGC